ncbi:dTDP-4-dehydrorhamnose reductase [Pseudonocardia endophytica]|uniref:dTDP-4-dehydrorhamnose reductase n=1 Tax=Pseudonocardia endophytica TaxID=401976 RepID=A0A4R1HJ09_PSEEN|nr:dTDP-4-dehydrorhamnose reductase [Pseudonocardia endophytica]TCK20961.1 dTDP-4-dehydrorhamnose reductase [Pseudonocardia endophytica]
MRAVVLGGSGQLGRALRAELPDAAFPGRDELDVGDPCSVEGFDWAPFDTVVNAAAYTAVDRAETDPAGAWRVNAAGPASLAAAAVRHDLTLVQVSTEYVFDGTACGPVPESAPLCPVNVYGASKAAGELAVRAVPRHVVVRTSWLIGDGANFARTMLGLAARGVCPDVVDDQIGRPTIASDLARAVAALAGAEPGAYHATGDGEPVSWAEVARVVFAHAGRDPADVRPVSTSDYAAGRTMAPRPSNGVLSLERLGATGITMPDWRVGLESYLETQP